MSNTSYHFVIKWWIARTGIRISVNEARRSNKVHSFIFRDIHLIIENIDYVINPLVSSHHLLLVFVSMKHNLNLRLITHIAVRLLKDNRLCYIIPVLFVWWRWGKSPIREMIAQSANGLIKTKWVHLPRVGCICSFAGTASLEWSWTLSLEICPALRAKSNMPYPANPRLIQAASGVSKAEHYF